MSALLNWLANGERGISSNTMVTVLAGVDALGTWSQYHPLDPDDFRRCCLLLEAVPILRLQLERMRGVSAQWATIVDHWEELEAMLKEECGSWPLTRWDDIRAPRAYDYMKSLGL